MSRTYHSLSLNIQILPRSKPGEWYKVVPATFGALQAFLDGAGFGSAGDCDEVHTDLE